MTPELDKVISLTSDKAIRALLSPSPQTHTCNVCNKLFVDRMPRPDWMGCI